VQGGSLPPQVSLSSEYKGYVGRNEQSVASHHKGDSEARNRVCIRNVNWK